MHFLTKSAKSEMHFLPLIGDVKHFLTKKYAKKGPRCFQGVLTKPEDTRRVFNSARASARPDFRPFWGLWRHGDQF